MDSIYVVAVASSEETRVALYGQLGALDFISFDGVHIELSDAVKLCQQRTPDVIIIELTGREMDAGLFMQAINMNIDNPSVIMAMHRTLDQSIIFEAVRQGAREFIQYPEEKEKLEASLRRQFTILNRSAKSSQQVVEEKEVGKIVSVFSCKGGSGASTVAVNLAHELHLLVKAPVMLVDMDLFFNNTAVLLSTKPSYALGDLAQSNPSDVDEALIRKIIVNHDSGLDIIVGSKSVMDENDMVAPELLEKILDYLVEQYPYIIIDLPSRILDPYHELLAQRSNMVLLVSSLDVPSLYRTRQYLDLTRQFFDEQKIKLVLNRYDQQAAIGMSNKNLEDEFRYPVFAHLSNDWKLNVSANSLGCMLSKVNPNAELVKDIKNMAGQVSGVQLEDASAKKATGGLLGKFLGGLNTNKRGDERNALSQTELGI